MCVRPQTPIIPIKTKTTEKNNKATQEGDNDNYGSPAKQKFDAITEEYIRLKIQQPQIENPQGYEIRLRRNARENGGYLEFTNAELEKLRRNNGVETGPSSKSADPSFQVCEATDQKDRKEQERERQRLRNKLEADIQAQVHQHSHSWLKVCRWIVCGNYLKEHQNLAQEILRAHCPEDLDFAQEEHKHNNLARLMLDTPFGQKQILNGFARIQERIESLWKIGSSYADQLQAELDQFLKRSKLEPTY